ncbi:phage tail protein [Yersinia enterocolitica]|nr:phage tail protein [Yersinia enterocolitica]
MQPWISGLTEEWRDWLQKAGVALGSRSPILLPKDGASGFNQAQPNMIAKEGMDSKRDYMISLGARLVEQNSAVKTATQATGDQAASTSVLGICCANVSTSGWAALNDLVAKVTASTATTLTLGSINTSNTDRFAVGGGVGTVKKVESWIEIPQITEVSNSGGDQQMIQIQFLSDTRQRNLNTFKAAQSQTLTLAHDSSLPVYPVLRAADESEQTLATYMYVPKAKENRYILNKISATPYWRR